jgi:hypothetical protein
MGYMMHLMDSEFRITKDQIPDALAAIKSLAGKETIAGYKDHPPHFSWVITEEFLNAKTLHDAFQAWNWSLDEEVEDDAVLFDFLGEKRGDEHIFFNAIAPYVKPGSFIQMVGEDGVIWRWYFDGHSASIQFGRVIFDEMAYELVLQRVREHKVAGWYHLIPEEYEAIRRSILGEDEPSS